MDTTLTIPDALSKLAAAVAADRSAERDKQLTRAQLRAAVQDARRAGARVTSIQSTLGLSRTRTNALLDGVRPVDANQ